MVGAGGCLVAVVRRQGVPVVRLVVFVVCGFVRPYRVSRRLPELVERGVEEDVAVLGVVHDHVEGRVARSHHRDRPGMELVAVPETQVVFVAEGLQVVRYHGKEISAVGLEVNEEDQGLLRVDVEHSPAADVGEFVARVHLIQQVHQRVHV